jgi:hypothetical protein
MRCDKCFVTYLKIFELFERHNWPQIVVGIRPSQNSLKYFV